MRVQALNKRQRQSHESDKGNEANMNLNSRPSS
jgi:hypothetical protein